MLSNNESDDHRLFTLIQKMTSLLDKLDYWLKNRIDGNYVGQHSVCFPKSYTLGKRALIKLPYSNLMVCLLHRLTKRGQYKTTQIIPYAFLTIWSQRLKAIWQKLENIHFFTSFFVLVLPCHLLVQLHLMSSSIYKYFFRMLTLKRLPTNDTISICDTLHNCKQHILVVWK